ncbi:hypothetical protein HHK36_015782 [Tetracentron sinense]|uniref:Sister chromatid cohesion 1 protein 2 n=1 Tax=Tetracentron sinense TaxID=13715 RepID=A0A834Z5T3_TETSI|nr:hypothetical protein HHK36_015782 [Tetracentron sinense]
MRLYSNCSLSRKGPLGTIWIAAYFHNRLKKHLVVETDISTSVDKILLDEIPVFTYRVLGYLLLGIVRIYSKKVNYLFHDCREVLIKVNDFTVSKKVYPRKEAISAPYLSITLPDKFELDAFDLEILEDSCGGGNVKPREEIMLEDAWENEGNKHYSLNKYHHEELDACLEIYSNGCTLVEEYVEDVLSPHMMEIDMLVSPSHNLSSLEASVEKLQGNQFPHEKYLDLEIFCEAEEPLDFGTQFDEEDNDVEQIKLLEMTLSDMGKYHVHTEGIATGPAGTSDESKFPYSSGQLLQTTKSCVQGCYPLAGSSDFNSYINAVATTPEFMVIPTPAKKEQAPNSRKRKFVCDEMIVLPNEVVRQSIHDSSSLVCKRRKAPHTALDTWKAYRISKLSQNFLEPLVSCISVELKSLFYKKSLKTPEPVEATEGPSKLEEVVGFETSSQSAEQKVISQEKYVNLSSSGRSADSSATTMLDQLGPITLVASIGKEPSPIEIQDLGLNLMDEMDGQSEPGKVDRASSIFLFSSSSESLLVGSPFIVCRAVASYLRKSFLNQKEQRQEEVVNLVPVLEGRTRKESSRLFYEILVLKTEGFVDVKQDNPYDDILVLTTPQIEATL